jgi:hypothetical protein
MTREEHDDMNQPTAPDRDSALDLIRYTTQEFERTGLAHYAAEAFVLSVQLGECPPAPVMSWVAGGLQKWLTTEGKADVGQELKLSRRKGQRVHPYHAPLEERAQRRSWIVAMDVLMYLGATRDQAAEIALSSRAAGDIPSHDRLVRMHADMAGPNGERQKLRQLDLLESIENPVWLQRFLDLFAAKDQIEKVLSMPPVRGI